MAAIVAAMATSVVLGGVLIRLLDPRDFPNVGVGMWWALQTVTTVGYGDVLPQSTVGRLVAAVVMLESIAFISIATAAITSRFVERARRERTFQPTPPQLELAWRAVTRLDEITARLDRIERAIEDRQDGPVRSE